MNQEAQKIGRDAESELEFKTSRSSGSGGQHVNKVETRVTLRWDISSSLHLTASQRNRILARLSHHINKEGIMVIHDESSRSQLRNKENTIRKWNKLLGLAFHDRKRRKRTSPTKSSRENNRKFKTRRSQLKSLRKKPRIEE